MKKFLLKSKSLIAVVFLAAVFVFGVTALPLAPVFAQGRAEVCEGLGGCESADASNLRVAGVIQAALNIVSIVIGIAGVIMVMLGGFRYVNSGGDASKTASAQNTILWALVGLAIAALAQVIVQFVLARI